MQPFLILQSLLEEGSAPNPVATASMPLAMSDRKQSSSNDKNGTLLVLLAFGLVAAAGAYYYTTTNQTPPPNNDKEGSSFSSEKTDIESQTPPSETATPEQETEAPPEAPPKKLVSVNRIEGLPSRDSMAEFFDKMDINHNGRLAMVELSDAWKLFVKDRKHKASVTKAFKAADASEVKDGSLSKTEFETFVRYIFCYDQFHDAFGGANNSLDRSAFRKAAQGLCVEDPEAVFGLIDTSSRGKVAFSDFCAWIARNADFP